MDIYGHISVSWLTVQILCILILKETIRMRHAIVIYECSTLGQVVCLEGPTCTCMMSLDVCVLFALKIGQENFWLALYNLCYLRLIDVNPSLIMPDIQNDILH